MISHFSQLFFEYLNIVKNIQKWRLEFMQVCLMCLFFTLKRMQILQIMINKIKFQIVCEK